MSAADDGGPRIWRAAKVEATVGLGRERIRQLEEAGRFPRRFKLVEDGQVNGWSAEEVERWVRHRIDSPRIVAGTKPPLDIARKNRAKGAA